MKRIVLSMAACALLFTSCKDAPDADKAVASEAQQVEQSASMGAMYKADPAQSKLEWVGTKATGRHHGTLTIKEGSLAVDAGNITAGRFVIDVNSITPDDQDAEGNAKLQGHLKSADFFDVQKYPEGIFEITGVQPGVNNSSEVKMKDATHTITGNLTLKGATKSISFPAKVSISDAQVVADANFNIDRTQWGVNYGSDKSLGDKFIHTDVNLNLHLVANK